MYPVLEQLPRHQWSCAAGLCVVGAGQGHGDFYHRPRSACAVAAVQDARSQRAAIAEELAVANAALRRAAALGYGSKPPMTMPPAPLLWCLTAEQATQLQTWVGTSSPPGTWTEVYRGSRDGFGTAAFSSKCYDKPHLLVLVKSDAGWLFGGYTSVGRHSSSTNAYYADAGAFIFSLVNSQGISPVKLAPKEPQHAMCTYGDYLFRWGGSNELFVAPDANTNSSSASSLSGVHYMAPPTGGVSLLTGQLNWRAAELVAFVVPL